MGVFRAPDLVTVRAPGVPLGAPPLPPRRLAGSLEEVVLAVHALPAAEAALGQRRVAVAALEAFAVPVAVQSLEDEAVQDVLVAAGTQRDLCRQGGATAVRPPHRAGGLPIPPSSQDRAARRPPSPHTLVPGRLEWPPSSPSSGRVWLRSPRLAHSRNPGQLKLGLEMCRGRRAPRPPLQIPSTAKTFPVHEGRTLSSNETLAPGAVSEAGLETWSLPSPEAWHTWAMGHPPPRGPHSSHNQAPWHLETCGRCGCLAPWPVPRLPK